jgi:hypothetical protein
MTTREKVRGLLNQGKGVKEIARGLGLSKATVSYHKRRLGLPIDTKCARRYDWAEIQRYYDAGHSRRGCQQQFGFSSASWTDAVRRGDIVPRPFPMPLDELLVANVRRGRWNVRQRLLSAGLKSNTCEQCGINEWLGKPLSMALHHINGDGRDNRIENLRLLCPNCHSQTPNFSGKNCRRLRGGKPRPRRATAPVSGPSPTPRAAGR